MKSTDIPNGIVVRGPRGVPVLIDFDEKGNIENTGMEVSISGWDSYDEGIPEDVAVLVHSVKGEEGMLVKNLEISHIQKDGEKTTIGKVAKMGVFNQMAITLREKYIEKLKKKESDEGLHILKGPKRPDRVSESDAVREGREDVADKDGSIGRALPSRGVRGRSSCGER